MKGHPTLVAVMAAALLIGCSAPGSQTSASSHPATSTASVNASAITSSTGSSSATATQSGSVTSSAPTATASSPWTLSSQSGTHFVGVWVADAAHNRSHLTWNAIEFASLLLPGTHVAAGQGVPYLVYYPAGTAVTADLTASSGEAHLFVWNPGNLFAPDQTSATPGSTTQSVTFSTPTAGIYLFLVYGKTDAVYDLSITPGGGPRAASPTAVPAGGSVNPLSPGAAADGITFNPVLPQSGLDPLSVAPDPSFNTIYLPGMSH